jgi:hypothetical protein
LSGASGTWPITTNRDHTCGWSGNPERLVSHRPPISIAILTTASSIFRTVDHDSLIIRRHGAAGRLFNTKPTRAVWTIDFNGEQKQIFSPRLEIFTFHPYY